MDSMEVSTNTAMDRTNTGDYNGTPANRGNYALTREKLYLLNLENNNKKLNPVATTTIPTDYNNSYTTTPELSNSSSSSSTNSLEADNSNQTSHQDGNQGLYKYYNGSDSSIATIVQKLSSSDSTVNLVNSTQQQEPTHEQVVVLKPGFDHLENSTAEDTDNEATSISSMDRATDDHLIPRSLKSSLKLPGLTRSKSLPSTKTVRFSSDLTKIKTFNYYAKPSSISLENSPDQSPPYVTNNGSRAYFDLKAEDFNNHSAPWFDQSSSESEEEEEEETYYAYKASVQNKWKLMNMNFDLFKSNSSQSLVSLSSLYIQKDSIIGLVQVLNISFEKHVEIKFTVDNWQTIYIVNANFERSLNSKKDQFKFELNLNNSMMVNKSKKSSPINIELCIKYYTQGVTYYDNNNSSNFKFQLLHNKNSSSSSNRRRGSNSSSSFNRQTINHIDDNFASAIISPPISQNLYSSTGNNYTTSRYFSDDTDYFNNKYFTNTIPSTFTSSSHEEQKKQSNIQHYGSTSSSNASTISSINSSNISTTSNSSNETIKASTTLNENKDNDLDSINAQSLQKSRQHYNEFLKKYCFFKTDDKKDNESVFIR